MEISNPRIGKSFGPNKCTKCGSNSTAFVGVSVGESFIMLCKNCLVLGEDLINRTILEQVRRDYEQ